MGAWLCFPRGGVDDVGVFILRWEIGVGIGVGRESRGGEMGRRGLVDVQVGSWGSSREGRFGRLIKSYNSFVEKDKSIR